MAVIGLLEQTFIPMFRLPYFFILRMFVLWALPLVWTSFPDSETVCFDEEFSRERCCVHKDALCFPDARNFIQAECCNEQQVSWWQDMLGEPESAQTPLDAWLYTISDFYTDAQYGADFGYYYRGRVLLNGTLDEGDVAVQAANFGTNEEEEYQPEGFAHYTTFPMALSPHFGAVMCRKLFIMWTAMDEPSEFPVFEFGAGSGQLASDIRELCGNYGPGRGNVTDAISRKTFEHAQFGRLVNKWGSRKFLRFRRAMRYTIVERSLALVQKQRRRGHEVVIGDAQDSETTCAAVKNDRKFSDAVILSNELIDAFAPAKLRLTLGGDASNCTSWQETRVLHIADGKKIAQYLGDTRSAEIADQSERLVDQILNSTVMRTVASVLRVEPGADAKTRLATILALTSLADHATDLRLPLYLHHMLLRLRQDRKLRERLQYVFDLELAELQKLETESPVILAKETYREIRKLLKTEEAREVEFIRDVLSRRVNGPLTQSRCDLYAGWMRRNQQSISRVQEHYRTLGYHATQFGVRPGEEKYMRLVDCLIGENRGFVISIDYGANFEALANSISSTPFEDGVSVPPIPPSLLTPGLPTDCQSNWLRCPGFIDYTSFIDFTNLAKAGEELGFSTILYGPQSSLERNLELSEGEQSPRQIPPLYEIKNHLTARTQWRHVTSWYGNENLPGVQRWTSFKTLVQGKNLDFDAMKLVNEWTVNWPISAELVDHCFTLDFTAYPQTDMLLRTEDGWRNLVSGNFKYHDLLNQYNELYEDAHLTMQLTDFLEGALGRAVFCKQEENPQMPQIAWWKIKNSRWSFVWNDQRITRILDLLYRQVFNRMSWTSGLKLEPGICLARRKFAILCGMSGPL